MRPASSNSWYALATEDWFGIVTMRIQRPSTRKPLTALNDCEPPDTCITARVRPCVGRTLPVSSGNQSICDLNTPVTAPCRSGLHQTCPSDHSDSARSSCTFGCSGETLSTMGKPCGSNTRVSAPKWRRMRSASSVSSLLYERSRKEPYSSRMRGAWVETVTGASLSRSGTSRCAALMFGKSFISSHRLAVGAHHGLAVFLGKGALLRKRQDLQHFFRRPAQAHAQFRDDDGAVDQDRMGLHGIEQGRIAQLWIGQAQLVVQGTLVAHHGAHGQPSTLDQVDQFFTRWRVLDVIDDDGLDARIADQGQGIARGAARGVVIDGDRHVVVSFGVVVMPGTQQGTPAQQFSLKKASKPFMPA